MIECSERKRNNSSVLGTEEEGDIARMRHRQRRGMLKMYYGVAEESGGKPSTIDSCDINGAHFKPEAYLEKIFKEKSLTELLDKETDIAKRNATLGVSYLCLLLLSELY